MTRHSGLLQFDKTHSISAYTRLSLSLRAWDDILSPHSSWPVSSHAWCSRRPGTCRLGIPRHFLAPPVAFDDRGLEDRALELGHPEFELACFRGGSALVMAGAERLAVIGALVSGSSGDLVRFRVGHRDEDPGYFLGDEPVEFSFEQVLVDLYDGVVGHGPRSVFALAVLLVWRLKIVYGTRAMPASTSQRRAKPKVRRNPDVIEGSMSCIVIRE